MGLDEGQMGGLLALGALWRDGALLSVSLPQPKVSKALLGPFSWFLRRKTPETDRKASFYALPPKKLGLSYMIT